jgi:hypothetical protein
MTRYGYFLSSEEHGPAELVRQARLAEETGFDALWICGHFRPCWTSRARAATSGRSSELSPRLMSAPCGPDPVQHISGIRAYPDADFDEVHIGQFGDECEGFFGFCAEQVLPRLRQK